jgi:heptosyltransferase-2
MKALIDRGKNTLLSHSIEASGVKHEVERNLDVIRYLGGAPKSSHLELWTTEDDERIARNIISEIGTDNIVAIAPGSLKAQKEWPAERFVEICRWLITDKRANIAILGGFAEIELAGAIEAQLGKRCVNLAGKLSLRQTFAVLRSAKLYFGSDSGPGHLAAAAGVPVVVVSCHPINGDSGHIRSPLLFRPWGVECRFVQPARPRDQCSECCAVQYAHCILGVSVGEAAEAIESVLRAGGSVSPANDAELRFPAFTKL